MSIRAGKQKFTNVEGDFGRADWEIQNKVKVICQKFLAVMKYE